MSIEQLAGLSSAQEQGLIFMSGAGELASTTVMQLNNVELLLSIFSTHPHHSAKTPY